MTKEEAIAKLNALSGDDPECEHGIADKVLTDFLMSNGYPEIAKAWDDACERVGFWFA